MPADGKLTRYPTSGLVVAIEPVMRAPVSGVAWMAEPTTPAGPALVVQSWDERGSLTSQSSPSTTARPA